MTATFWTGSSLSFTNGSKTVTVNTGPSLDSVKANSSLTAGNYNEPVEVKSVSGNTITLYNNWPGSTGTTSATIKPSAAAAASAGVAAQQLITDIQSLVSSASATATANSFVKRDSNGRIKAASPSANDDVVTKGYLGSAATKSIATETGPNEVDALMPIGYGGLGSSGVEVTDLNDSNPGSKFLRASPSALNLPPSAATNNWSGARFERFSTTYFEMWFALTENRVFGRSFNNGYRSFVEFLHSDRLMHAQNTSGATVASNATVPGSSLTPSKSGTWRNVSGGSISANNYGLWMAV